MFNMPEAHPHRYSNLRHCLQYKERINYKNAIANFKSLLTEAHFIAIDQHLSEKL